MNRSRSPLTSLLALLLVPAVVAFAVTMIVLTVWDAQQPPNTVMLPTNSGTALIPPLPTDTPTPGNGTQVSDQPTATEEAAASTAAPGCENPVHQVQEGDNLGFIAQEYDVSLDDLILINEMNDPEFSADFLSIGQEIIVPVCGIPTPTSTVIPTDTAVPTRNVPTPIPTTTELPPGTVIVEVTRVLSPGDVTEEAVEIINRGSSVARLGDWQIVNQRSGDTYTFPSLNLFPQGAVTVHTGVGQNTAIDVYWGLDSSVWQSGDTVQVLDSDGVVQSEYEVP